MSSKSSQEQEVSECSNSVLQAIVKMKFIEYKEIPLDKIKLPKTQLRTNSDKKDSELVKSISQFQIQPIVVRRIGKEETYEVIAGGRRLKAAVKGKLHSISAQIVEASDLDARLLMVKENIQRRDVNPMELAAFIIEMQKQHNLSQIEIAKLLNRDRSRISHLTGIYENPFLCKAVSENHLTEAAAEASLSKKNALSPEGEPLFKTAEEWEKWVRDRMFGAGPKKIAFEKARLDNKRDKQDCPFCGKTVPSKSVKPVFCCPDCRSWIIVLESNLDLFKSFEGASIAEKLQNCVKLAIEVQKNVR